MQRTAHSQERRKEWQNGGVRHPKVSKRPIEDTQPNESIHQDDFDGDNTPNASSAAGHDQRNGAGPMFFSNIQNQYMPPGVGMSNGKRRQQ